MKLNIDLTSVVPANKIKGEDHKETIQLKKILLEARIYLKQFKWCKRVQEAYLGIGVGDKLGVFLFKIIPTRPGVDNWLCIIVGDLPPAYISTVNAPNPASALDGYIGEMHDWVKAVKAKKPIDDLIPVNVPPTIANALELESRLKFIQDKILIYYKEDLKD